MVVVAAVTRVGQRVVPPLSAWRLGGGAASPSRSPWRPLPRRDAAAAAGRRGWGVLAGRCSPPYLQRAGAPGSSSRRGVWSRSAVSEQHTDEPEADFVPWSHAQHQHITDGFLGPLANDLRRTFVER